MSTATAAQSPTQLGGRHLDTDGGFTWLVRRLDPAAFVQSMLVVCLILILWPASFGGRFGLVTVAGRSMEPTYTLGDAVVTWKQPVEIGDVILFRVPEGDPGEGNPVIHRVVGGDSQAWITKGDNNENTDRWTASNRELLGVAQFRLPLGGRFLALMTSWLFIALIGGLATVLFLWPDAEETEGKPTGRHRA